MSVPLTVVSLVKMFDAGLLFYHSVCNNELEWSKCGMQRVWMNDAIYSDQLLHKKVAMRFEPNDQW